MSDDDGFVGAGGGWGGRVSGTLAKKLCPDRPTQPRGGRSASPVFDGTVGSACRRICLWGQTANCQTERTELLLCWGSSALADEPRELRCASWVLLSRRRQGGSPYFLTVHRPPKPRRKRSRRFRAHRHGEGSGRPGPSHVGACVRCTRVMHPEPFTVTALLPHWAARGSRRAQNRHWTGGKITTKARSSKNRPLLLADLERRPRHLIAAVPPRHVPLEAPPLSRQAQPGHRCVCFSLRRRDEDSGAQAVHMCTGGFFAFASRGESNGADHHKVPCSHSACLFASRASLRPWSPKLT